MDDKCKEDSQKQQQLINKNNNNKWDQLLDFNWTKISKPSPNFSCCLFQQHHSRERELENDRKEFDMID